MHGTLPIAKTYKTPVELGFTHEDFDALAWFVEQYDAGNVLDADIPEYDDSYTQTWESLRYANPIKPPDAFYMPYVSVGYGCKTAGCILGWVMHRVSHVGIATWPAPVQRLFMKYYDDVKAVHARDATVRVLQGKPAWR